MNTDDDEPEAAPPAHDLSEAELHDVVSVATAENEFESITLLETLEDAGIPAMKHGGLVHFGQLASSQVMVPRRLLEEARTAIARRRSAADERGVAQAFEAQNVDERFQDAQSDPITAKMIEIALSPKERRAEFAAPHVAEWLAESRQLPEIARYLAAAEFSREEADALVASVKSNSDGLLVESLRARARTGYFVSLCGVLMFLAPFFGVVFPFLMVVGACLFFAGLGIAALASGRLKKLEAKA